MACAAQGRSFCTPEETLAIVLELLEFSFPRVPRGAIFSEEPSELLSLFLL